MAKKKKEEVVEQEIEAVDTKTPADETNEPCCECEVTDAYAAGMTQNFTIGLDELLALEDIETRKIIIEGEITDQTYNRVNYFIMRCNAMDIGAPIEERDPIKLWISSCGGSCYAGLGIIEAIRTSNTPVITICNSYALSMGFHIFVAGHKRYATENAIFLNHEGYDEIWGHPSKNRDYLKFSEKFKERLNNLLIERTSFTERDLNETERLESYMFGDEAKKYGVVDYLIGRDVDIDDIL